MLSASAGENLAAGSHAVSETKSELPAAAAQSAGEVVQQRLIVRFNDSAASQGVQNAVNQLGGTIVRDLPLIHAVLVNVAHVGADVNDIAAQWRAQPGVAYVEPDYVYQIDAAPNDPMFDQLWGLYNTGQDLGTAGVDSKAFDAWVNSTGSSSIVVADIDTGTDYNHPDLAANIWTNPGEIAGDGIDNDNNGYVDDIHGIDTANDDSDPMDDHGHGTHTAGTIGAVGDNGVGVVGVNWNVKVMPLKFLGASGSGSLSDAIDAIQYMTMMKTQFGVNIVASNNSWGGGGYSQALYDAIQASTDAGIMFVAAAGNNNSDSDASPSYPAAYDLPGIISVGAIDRNDNRASFSNYGATTVDLAAPGVAILSTTPNNTYSTYNGTSMATPHVTGAVALAAAYAGNVGLAELKTAILNGTDTSPAFVGKSVTGGRLNILGMMQQLGLGVISSDPASLSVLATPPSDFTLHLNDSVDPATLDAADLTVNGRAADSVTAGDATTLIFHYNVSPVASQGRQTMAVSAGAFQRLSDHTGNGAWTGRFYYDLATAQVASMVPADGGAAAPPVYSIRFNFTEAMDQGSFDRSDLRLSRGLISWVNWIDADTADAYVSGLGSEGAVDVQILPGTLRDADGNPAGGYQSTFFLDYTSEAFPALQPVAPAGSMVYQQSLDREISFSGDSDTFTIALAAGQLLSVSIESVSTLAAGLQVTGPTGLIAGSATAGVGGQGVVLQTIPIASAGTYAVRVRGEAGSTGSYRLRLAVNAAIEGEEFGGPADDTPASAVDLSGSEIRLPGGAVRGAVLGSLGLPLQPVVSVVQGHVDQQMGSLDSIIDGVGSPRGSSVNWGLRWQSLDTVLQIDLGQSLPLTGLTLNAGSGDEYLLEYYDSASQTWQSLWNVPSYAAIVSGLVTRPDYGFTENERFHLLNNTVVTDKLRLSGTARTNSWFTVSELELRLAPDVYGLALEAGESISLALESTLWSYTRLELIDAQGTVLASAVDATNAQQIISHFVAPTGGVYYARVSGLGDYTLVTLREGRFESEPNAVASIAPLEGRATLLGAISTAAGERSARPAPLGQETYRLDGSQHDYATGYSPIDNLWLNQFTAAAGAEVIDSISVNFGPSMFAGTPASVLVFSDPNNDGDPHDAVLLNETRVEVAGSGFTEGWLTVPIVPTRVSGSFFVAALVRNNWEWGTPILYDVVSPNLQRSWTVLANAYAMDVEHLSRMFDFRRIDGNAAIRANASTAGDSDSYSIQASAGQSLHLVTGTPFGTAAALRNALDPLLELYDPDGHLVASNDNSAPDGRNADLRYTAMVTGLYTVRVRGALGSTGDYVLEINPPDPPTVVSIVRADPSPTSDATVRFTVSFNEAVSGVDAGDFALVGSGLTDVAITGVTGSGSSYTVTARAGGGRGRLRLDLVDNDTIVNAAGTPLGGEGAINGSMSGGEAYWINLVTSPLVDNADPTGFAAIGEWNIDPTGLFGDSLSSTSPPGARQSAAFWTFDVTPGTYDVAVTWTADPSLSSDTPFYAWDGSRMVGLFGVNQRQSPHDFSDQGVGWKRLGKVQVTGNTLGISTWNLAGDGNIRVDAVRLIPAGILDDGDAGFSATGAWTATATGLLGDSLTSTSTPGSRQSAAFWTFDVAPGIYDVTLTWTSQAGLSAAVPFYLWDGGALVNYASVDQRQAPRDLVEQGVGWKHLGPVSVSRGRLMVSTWNLPGDGNISVDAVRLIPAGIRDDGDAGFSAGGAWSAAAGLFGDSLTSSSTPGSRQSSAFWTFDVAPGIYDVALTWTSQAGLSAAVPFYFWDGGALASYASVDQRQAPRDLVDQGVGWKHVGPVSLNSGRLMISTWNLSGDGNISVDAVRLIPVGIRDDGDAGFSAGGAWSAAAGLFGDSLTSTSTPGSRQSSAFWTFDVAPGIYDVALTWTSQAGLSAAVPFYFWDGGALASYASVDQRQAPRDLVDQGVGWKHLGPVFLSSGRLMVSTWNLSGDGNISVDAVRIQPARALLAAASMLIPGPADSLRSDTLKANLSAALNRWAAAGADRQRLNAVSDVEFVITDLPQGYLALSAGRRIYLDSKAAGYGWFVDATPDRDEEFSPSAAASAKALDPRAVDRIDLLSVVAHELGHVMGYADDESGSANIMSPRLATGIRRLPSAYFR